MLTPAHPQPGRVSGEEHAGDGWEDTEPALAFLSVCFGKQTATVAWFTEEKARGKHG